MIPSDSGNKKPPRGGPAKYQSINQKNMTEKSNTDDTIQNVLEWGKRVGITGENGQGTVSRQYQKLLEEVGELGQGLIENDSVGTIDAIGDCTVVLVLLSSLLGLEFEECLKQAYDVISKRSGKMKDGEFVKNTDCQ